VAEPRDLRDLVGDDVPPEELERLRRVHDLLLAAGPPPELSPAVTQPPAIGAREPREGRLSFLPRRRLGTVFAGALGLAAIAFGAGYLAGHGGRGFEAKGTVVMRGTALAPKAVASIEIGKADASGNIPMLVHVRGLPKPSGRDYYELYLTRRREPVVSCGTFSAAGRTNFRLSVPYTLRRYDGWVVTRERPGSEHPGKIVLTTFNRLL
jgi:hypothetical protein